MAQHLRQEDKLEDADIRRWFSRGRLIGSGGFGSVYEGTDWWTGEQVAIKEAKTNGIKQLSREYKVYANAVGKVGIPQLKAFSESYLVMELLGDSLKSLFVQCDRRLSLETVLQLAVQMLSCVEQLHRCGFIHRDIKPDNFVMGRGNQSRSVYLIDFGLAKSYLHNGRHIRHRTRPHMVGTVCYSSLNSHRGSVQSRRDDLEALAYVFIKLLGNRIPWDYIGVAKDRQERNHLIYNSKVTTSPETLCHGLPYEFVTYLNYCRGLDFAQDPDYEYLRHLFIDLARRLGIPNDGFFDWDYRLGRERGRPI